MTKNIEHQSLYSMLNRRDFVSMAGGCAGLSGLSVLNTLLNLRLTSSLMAQEPGDDYKALVCVFLFGGNDSHNLLAPYNINGDAGSQYGDHLTGQGGYVEIRRGVYNPDPNKPADDVGTALPRDIDIDSSHELYGMSLKPLGAAGDYGIHGYFNDIKGYDADGNYDGTKAPGYMQQLYTEGELAFVANVGSAERPLNKSNWSANRPVGVFSHSDEQRNWMTSIPQSRGESIGWAGRVADVLTDPSNTIPIPMGIGLNSNIWQTGKSTLPYIVTTGGAFKLAGYNGGSSRDKILTMSTNDLLASQYANLLEMTHANARRDAIDAANAYTDTVAAEAGNLTEPWPWLNRPSNARPPGGQPPRNNLADQMRQVAQAILAAQNNPGVFPNRQVFFVFRGGFDNHSNLIGNHSGSLPQVSEALYHFTEEMKGQGLLDKVTTFTMSDFGRTNVGNNNEGTDHGWASIQTAIGGADLTGGGKILGEYYDMSNAAEYNTNGGKYTTDRRGRVIPGVSVDQYVEELVRWFGVSDTDLPTILPNIGNFAGESPLGLMS